MMNHEDPKNHKDHETLNFGMKYVIQKCQTNVSPSLSKSRPNTLKPLESPNFLNRTFSKLLLDKSAVTAKKSRDLFDIDLSPTK